MPNTIGGPRAVPGQSSATDNLTRKIPNYFNAIALSAVPLDWWHGLIYVSRGDIKALEGRLSGYHRLRVGPFRIVFRFLFQDQARMMRCEFIERRSVVYEMMESLVSRLKS